MREAFKEGQKTCCFCGRTGTRSQEHIWPTWAHPNLPAGEQNYYTKSRSKGNRLLEHRKLQGSTFNIRLKVVCAACNNTWMSGLESAVKPWLLPMLQGQPIRLDVIAQSRLAKYFVMKSMVADLSRNSDVIFSQEDRTELHQAREIPVGVSVSLYFYSAPIDEVTQYNKETFRGVQDNGVDRSEPLMGNITFRFGPIFVQVLCNRYIKDVPKPDQSQAAMIHPFNQAHVDWPPIAPLTTADAFTIQHVLEFSGRQAGLPLAE